MASTNSLTSAGETQVSIGDAFARERVKQAHKACLDAIYAVDYFQEMNSRTVRYSKHLDFAIGLGAVTSGGSGLGILGDPRFAWLCGLLTTVSLVLTVAKTTYDWPGKSKFIFEMVECYAELSQKLKFLVDDLNVRHRWDAELEQRFLELRNAEAAIKANPYPELPEAVARDIQNRIKRRIPYSQWWKPRDDASEAASSR